MRECSNVKEVVKVYEQMVEDIEVGELEQFEESYTKFAVKNGIEKIKVFTDESETDCFDQFGLALVNGSWKMVYMEGNNNQVAFYIE